jgi:hypothetical protein
MALLHSLSVPSKQTRDSSSSLDTDLNYPVKKEFNGLESEINTPEIKYAYFHGSAAEIPG